MLPSRLFKTSQRHQTHLHFWAGVITIRECCRVQDSSGRAFGKENFQSLQNTAPWFQPGVPRGQETVCHISLHTSSSGLSAEALSAFSGKGRRGPPDQSPLLLSLSVKMSGQPTFSPLPVQAGGTFWNLYWTSCWKHLLPQSVLHSSTLAGDRRSGLFLPDEISRMAGSLGPTPGRSSVW